MVWSYDMEDLTGLVLELGNQNCSNSSGLDPILRAVTDAEGIFNNCISVLYWTGFLGQSEIQLKITINFIDISTSSRSASSVSSSDGNFVKVFRRRRNSSSRVMNPFPFKSYVRNTTKVNFIQNKQALTRVPRTKLFVMCLRPPNSNESLINLKRLTFDVVIAVSSKKNGKTLNQIFKGNDTISILVKPYPLNLTIIVHEPWIHGPFGLVLNSAQAGPGRKHCSFVQSYLHRWCRRSRKSNLTQGCRLHHVNIDRISRQVKANTNSPSDKTSDEPKMAGDPSLESVSFPFGLFDSFPSFYQNILL